MQNRILPLVASALALAAQLAAADAPLKVEVPKPLFAGTPRPISLANLEPAGIKRLPIRLESGTGDAITGIDTCGAQVFHAGTKLGPKGLETSGGRVLGVTSSGPDLTSAIHGTYDAVNKIHFDGMHYRRDIAQKGLKRWA